MGDTGATVDSGVLVTGDKAKLPPDIAAVLDPAIPLPGDALFFEKRYDADEVLKRVLFATGFGLAALVIVPFGVYCVFHSGPATVYNKVDWLPLGFGLICGFVAWWMATTVITCVRLRERQARGESVRHGTFLTPAALIQASDTDTTVIPPAGFRGLDGQTLKYFHNNADHTFRLPTRLINSTPEHLQAAIRHWAATHAAGSPSAAAMPPAANSGFNE